MSSLLIAQDVPAETTALKAKLTEMLSFAPIVSLPIVLDKTPTTWTASPTPAANRPAARS